MFNVSIKGDICQSTLTLIENAIAQTDTDVMLTIDSVGGSLQYGMLCYDRIRESGKNFYANVVGNCMSSATLLLVACPLANRTASAHSTILIHNPLANCGLQSLNDVKSLLGTMEDAKAKLVQIYAERTLMLAEDVSRLMDEERELYATDCVEKGLIAKCNNLYNYNKTKVYKTNMKKSFITMLTNKLVKALLNEGYVAEDGSELEISAIEVGGTCSKDGVFVVDGYTITVEGGIIIDVIAPTEETEETPIENEGEETEPIAEPKVEEVAEVVEEKVAEAETIEDLTEIAEIIKQEVEAQLADIKNKYENLKSLVNKCGGEEKLNALANVKHSAKVFNAETKVENNNQRSIKELVAMKRK